jgi:probable rRNA maturation factor
VTIEVLDECGSGVDGRALVDVARHVLDRMGVSPLAELSISLQDAAEMERLHRQYLDEPGPTDVLAFPIDELDLRGSRGVPQGSVAEDDDVAPAVLGDVVLCPPVAARQAEEARHSLLAELQLLTTHGVLHLLGFDHGSPDEHDEMFGLQAELLRSFAGSRGDGEQVRGAQAEGERGQPAAAGQREPGDDA